MFAELELTDVEAQYVQYEQGKKKKATFANIKYNIYVLSSSSSSSIFLTDIM